MIITADLEPQDYTMGADDAVSEMDGPQMTVSSLFLAMTLSVGLWWGVIAAVRLLWRVF